MHGEKHTKITGSNVNAAKRDDKDHIDYLKRDINYDAKNGGSNSQMTADEQHITNLAKDVNYDDKTKPVAAMHGKTHGGAKMYDKGPKMESNAQEKKNLINDNPIASRASGGSWMSKHSKSKM